VPEYNPQLFGAPAPESLAPAYQNLLGANAALAQSRALPFQAAQGFLDKLMVAQTDRATEERRFAHSLDLQEREAGDAMVRLEREYSLRGDQENVAFGHAMRQQRAHAFQEWHLNRQKANRDAALEGLKQRGKEQAILEQTQHRLLGMNSVLGLMGEAEDYKTSMAESVFGNVTDQELEQRITERFPAYAGESQAEARKGLMKEFRAPQKKRMVTPELKLQMVTQLLAQGFEPNEANSLVQDATKGAWETPMQAHMDLADQFVKTYARPLRQPQEQAEFKLPTTHAEQVGYAGEFRLRSDNAGKLAEDLGQMPEEIVAKWYSGDPPEKQKQVQDWLSTVSGGGVGSQWLDAQGISFSPQYDESTGVASDFTVQAKDPRVAGMLDEWMHSNPAVASRAVGLMMGGGADLTPAELDKLGVFGRILGREPQAVGAPRTGGSLIDEYRALPQIRNATKPPISETKVPKAETPAPAGKREEGEYVDEDLLEYLRRAKGEK
jgi:hypothetical protein